MKVLKPILLTLALLIAATVLALILFLGPLLEGVVERGATYATGVKTEVGNVSLGLFSGELGLEELSIQNPEGFRPEPFLKLADGHAKWDNRSLMSDRIEVDRLALEGIDINLERNGGKTNYGKILDNLKKLSSKDAKPPDADGRKKTLIIRHIEIRNVKAGVHLSDTLVGSGSMNVDVPLIELHDFQTDGSTTEIVAKLTRILIQAVLEGAVKAGGKIIPGDMLEDLGSGLEALGKTLEESVIGDVGKTIGEGAQDVMKGAGDLFKKKK